MDVNDPASFERAGDFEMDQGNTIEAPPPAKQPQVETINPSTPEATAPAQPDIEMANQKAPDTPSLQSVKRESPFAPFGLNSKDSPIDLEPRVSPFATGRAAGTRSEPFTIDDTDDEDCFIVSGPSRKGRNCSNSRIHPINITDDEFVVVSKGKSPEIIIKDDESESKPSRFPLSHSRNVIKAKESDAGKPIFRNPPNIDDYEPKPKVEEDVEERKPGNKRKLPPTNPSNAANPTRGKKRQKAKDQKKGKALLHGILNQRPGGSKNGVKKEKPLQFKATNKKDALKILRDNLPKGTEKLAWGDRAAVDAATKFISKKCRYYTEDDRFRLKGMKTGLYHYQAIGVAWMLDREENPENGSLLPFGGICADSMGVGKTIQMLAVINANRPPASGPQATLIIVPTGIKKQWRSEILKHTDITKAEILVYKRDTEQFANAYKAAKIVIATWYDLSKSCPSPQDNEHEDVDGESGADNKDSDKNTNLEQWRINNPEKGGLLHRIKWRRVVLDESQHIANHKSKQSLGAAALQADFRWALSGTPVQNSTREFYSYFRFLKHPLAPHSYRAFGATLADDRNDATLSGLLSKMMIHRTPEDTLFGRPIIDLLAKHIEKLPTDLCADEEIIYRAFEECMRNIMNAGLDESHSCHSLTYVMVRITRLRQCASHPLAVEKWMKLLFEMKDLEEIRTKLIGLYEGGNPENRTLMGRELLDRVNKWIEGKKENLNDVVEEDKVCQECGEDPNDPHFINLKKCQHLFCLSCISYNIDGQLEESDITRCPVLGCQVVFDYDRHVRRKLLKNAHDKKSDFDKGRDALNFHPQLNVKESQWLIDYDNEKIPLLLGAKMQRVREKLEEWLREAPNEKFIIFAEYQHNLATVGRILEALGAKFIYLTGSMNSDKRAFAIRLFEEEVDIKVMVSGLKCGGVGLNLAFASRMLNIDPWWNIYVELQAYGRIHRRPQDLPTYFGRPLVGKSIDARIYDLQVSKEREIESALNSKATEVELVSLFGRVVSEDGNMRVEADYDDEPQRNVKNELQEPDAEKENWDDSDLYEM